MLNKVRGRIKNHPYNVLGESPWPILMSINIMNMLLLIGLKWNNYIKEVRYIMIITILTLIINIGLWIKDIYVESKLLGDHTRRVKKILKEGFIIFQISEIMIFVSLLVAYWCYSMNADIRIGMQWPPKGLKTISPIEWSLINTLILLISGISITYAEKNIILSNKKESILGILITISLIIIFVYFQKMEYKLSSITILDGIFGSIFYILTGLHGFHMILLIIMLLYTKLGLILNWYTKESHLSFELAVIYLHLLDIIWLWLYYWLYWWIF